MTQKKEVILEIVEYCISKLRELDGILIIMRADVYEAREQKDEDRIDKLNKQLDYMGAKLEVYMDLINRLNTINDAIEN